MAHSTQIVSNDIASIVDRLNQLIQAGSLSRGYICEVQEHDDNSMDANCRLIAAAPDLLAALREAQSCLAMMVEPNAIQTTSAQHAFAHAVAAERKCRSAIAKATAETGDAR